MRTLHLILLALLLVGCSDPVSMIPGGKLSGETLDAPVQWIDVPETIQVETRPSNPYSINIWSVGIGQNLYIATGADGTRWSEFIDSDAKVRARLGTSLYKLSAVQVIDAVERKKVGAAYVAKYDLDSQDNWLLDGLIFRLERRQQSIEDSHLT